MALLWRWQPPCPPPEATRGRGSLTAFPSQLAPSEGRGIDDGSVKIACGANAIRRVGRWHADPGDFPIEPPISFVPVSEIDKRGLEPGSLA
jgi:hypothetical protein